MPKTIVLVRSCGIGTLTAERNLMKPWGKANMQIRKFHTIATCLAALAMFVSVSAQANLVTNGDFETGDFTGWSVFGAGFFTGVDSTFPQSGSFAAFFGEPVQSPSGIFQSLTTVAGQVYNVTFWLMNENDVTELPVPNSFAFNWDGGAVEFSLTNVGATP